jgi:hypothetical protein
MKKVFSIWRLSLMLLGFVLVSAVGSALQAQTLNTIAPTAQRSWMDNAEALTALATEIATLEQQFQSPPPSADLNVLKTHHLMLEYVQIEIVSGKATQAAVFTGFDKVKADSGAETPNASVSEADLNQILVKVIDLLDK